tara:strand:- start:133 stop:627 length:495 start_codon:yes stop_codon:yes gene_type:complete
MGKLPFEMPLEIHDDCFQFDRGYINGYLPNLELGDPIKKHQEIKDVLDEFGRVHNNAMLYAPKREGKWFVCNYAYEDIGFLPFSFTLEGLAYHVTHWDGTLNNGDRKNFFHMAERGDTIVVPFTLKSQLKSFLQYDKSSNMLQLFIGDTYEVPDLLKMPEFSKK